MIKDWSTTKLYGFGKVFEDSLWQMEDEVVCLGNLNRNSPRQVESKNAVLFYGLLCMKTRRTPGGQ